MDLPRVGRAACVGCRCFAQEVEVPVGDGGVRLCWLCAHAVAVHGVAVGAPLADCGCPVGEVYPADVADRMARDRAANSVLRPAARPTPPKLEPRRFTMTTRCRKPNGDVDERGPILTQTFERVGRDRVRLVDVKVEPGD